MTQLHGAFEAPIRLASSPQLEALSAKFVPSRFDLIHVGGHVEINTTILPSGPRPIVGLRLCRLHQPRRRTTNSAPSEEHQRHETRTSEFHHTFDVADPTRGWKS